MRLLPRVPFVPALVLIVAALPGIAAAPCAPQWLPGGPRLCPSGNVAASTTWDPDGAGPLPTVLVAGGRFDAATTLGASAATWDGAQWTVLDGLAGRVTAMANVNGDLFAA